MPREQMYAGYVLDGDTVRCGRSDSAGTLVEEVRVRLFGIDAPELSQAPWGLWSRAYLRRQLAQYEHVDVEVLGQDSYGRLIAYLVKRDGTDLGLLMVVKGEHRASRRHGRPSAAVDANADDALCHRSRKLISEKTSVNFR